MNKLLNLKERAEEYVSLIMKELIWRTSAT
jgi:hypothetical protein